MTNQNETPVGYTYKAENYGPTELVNELVRRGDRAPGAWGMSAESVLEQWAAEEGLDRDDLHSFDSDDFPKPIYEGQLTCDDNNWTTKAPQCVWVEVEEGAYGQECANCGATPSHDY